jgi:hypothetical protein
LRYQNCRCGECRAQSILPYPVDRHGLG